MTLSKDRPLASFAVPEPSIGGDARLASAVFLTENFTFSFAVSNLKFISSFEI